MTQCIFCNEDEQKVFFKIKTHSFPYALQKCTHCHAYTLAPTPTTEQLDKAYNTGYYGEGEAKFNPIIEFGVNLFRSMRASRAVKGIPESGKLLDIGCGSGAFLNFLHKKYNLQLSGLEIEGDAALRAADQNKGFTLYTGFLQTTDFSKETFDVITIYHVFEHLLTPNEDLGKIQQILKPNGRLVISMPNIDSWQAKFFKDDWFHLDVPRHLIFFKPKDFKRMMQAKGFEIETERYISWEQNPYGYIQSSLNVLSKKHNFLYEFLKTNEKSAFGKRNLFQIGLHVLFAGITLPLFLLVDLFESLFKKSATVEYTFRYQPK
ncbi:class I SAM-dependent methyltransferase [uncultured Kordia sp.]|uniref:class I SAM-dependent methyltransferase n=1 Tax=uncultured Kordia sp. TaxID=507699 RepID=UPI002613A89E|nr:class I SAM-dependent methyltransferase [uncultured Kordia sp.]